MNMLMFKQVGQELLSKEIQNHAATNLGINVEGISKKDTDILRKHLDTLDEFQASFILMGSESVLDASEEVFKSRALSKKLSELSKPDVSFVLSGLAESDLEVSSYEDSETVEKIKAGMMALVVYEVLKEHDALNIFGFNCPKDPESNKMLLSDAIAAKESIRRLILDKGQFEHLSLISKEVSLFDFEMIKAKLHKGVATYVDEKISFVIDISQSTQDPEDFAISFDYSYNDYDFLDTWAEDSE